MGETVLHVTTE